MELLSVNLARVLWFVDARDVNPRGLNLRNTFFPALVEKYKFIGYPTPEDLSKPDREPGEKFTGGEFNNSQGAKLMINFTSFDDGFLVDTRSSTKDSEDFLIELAEWVTHDFGLTFRPDMIRSRGYVSELIVRTVHRLSGLNSTLQSFADKLSMSVSKPDTPISFDFSGISFSVDTSLSLKPSSFLFERAIDATFSENRYFSRAPVPTDTHLTLLNEFEQILAS